MSSKLKPFTVLGFDPENDKIFSDHVFATSPQKAMFNVSVENDHLNILCAVAGHLVDGEHVDYAGDALVDAQTIISQPEVFNVN